MKLSVPSGMASTMTFLRTMCPSHLPSRTLWSCTLLRKQFGMMKQHLPALSKSESMSPFSTKVHVAVYPHEQHPTFLESQGPLNAATAILEDLWGCQEFEN